MPTQHTYDTYHPYLPLALRLELRPSELLGLRWTGVNLAALTASPGEPATEVDTAVSHAT